MTNLIGRIIAGRYRVETFLGKGGMAEVYKVWDQERTVHLAMKILHSDLAEDKVFLRRFKREAQTLAKLQHPNIVRFYGLEQDDDLVYMLMDYVEGTTLRKEIFQSKEPFIMERILEILKPVCAALYYAHKAGFVHCDVKPANIMIHKNGSIFLSDFGIARMTEAATVTMVGAGTPAYMAPEQARGEDPLPQTDIYALGIVLFEMLTGGERPFTGESAKTTGSTSEKVRWEQMRLAAPPPSKFNPPITQSMDGIVLKCLEKSPASRYLSATDLLSDLTQAVQVNISAQPKGETTPVSAGATRTDTRNVDEQPKDEIAQQQQPASQPKEIQQVSPLPRKKLGVTLVSLIGGGIVILLFFLIFGRNMMSQAGLPTVPPIFTPEPTAIATLIPSPTPLPRSVVIPSPTPLPGSVVIPLDSFDNSIPWLPIDNSARSGTYFFYFNLEKPPFNSVLVRQAFAAAIDREALVEIAKKYGANNPRPATTFTPPETLGRDLYNEVGIPFNPANAKDLLAQAGYSDPSKFPPVTLLINVGGDAAPGFHVKITDEMVKMWQQYLGVKVTVEVINWGPYLERIDSSPSEIFRLTWAADYNDPDNFLREIFKSGSQYNYGNFSNTEFNKLVDRAAKSTDPAERQELYIQAERILCETEAALIPIYHSTYNIP